MDPEKGRKRIRVRARLHEQKTERRGTIPLPTGDAGGDARTPEGEAGFPAWNFQDLWQLKGYLNYE